MGYETSTHYGFEIMDMPKEIHTLMDRYTCDVQTTSNRKVKVEIGNLILPNKSTLSVTLLILLTIIISKLQNIYESR